MIWSCVIYQTANNNKHNINIYFAMPVFTYFPIISEKFFLLHVAMVHVLLEAITGTTTLLPIVKSSHNTETKRSS